jgi:ABC-2 type transport system ATP-binding protein
MSILISAQHLCKDFNARRAVDDLSLDVAGGEIYGLVGADGAGKTTSLRLLVGALRPVSGEASICGFSLRHQVEQARSQLGYLSQRFSFYEDLTVLENIRFFAEMRGLTRSEWLPRCTEILEFVGLQAFQERRAGQLSGGMKQKLGLAAALVTRPRVLLLDEPTTGVDPVTRQDFWQLLIRITHNRDLQTAGDESVAVLITTPYMDEASRCQRVGFMRLGRLIAEGTPSMLRSRLEGRIVEVRRETLAAKKGDIDLPTGVEQVRAFGGKLHLQVRPGSAQEVISAINARRHEDETNEITARLVTPTLEDVFLDLTREGAHEYSKGDQ